MNGKISRLYFAVFFSPEVLSKKNRWFMADSAAFCGNGQQIGKKLCWLSDDLNVRTIMNIAAYKHLQVFF